MNTDMLIRNAAVWGQPGPADLAISDGLYVDIGDVDPATATIIEAAGHLCVPGFIEPHIHLDKVMLADSIPVNASGSLDEAIEILGVRKQSYSSEDIVARAGHIIRAAISNGVTRMRTHIDIDTGCGLTAFDALLDVRAQFANLIELQIVAFPQKGIVGDPGCEALLREAMDRGADQIGGMPFNEAGPDESRAHIEIAFDIAREHDCAVDMHIDETDDPNARTLEMLCEATIAHGWQGRVIAGHTCALAAYPDDYAERVMDMVAAAGIHMITNPATNLMLQGREDSHPKRRGITRVKELLSRGVNVAFGQDNLRDMFYPFGRDDPLELAFLLAHAAHMSQPDEIEAVFTMTTDNAAKVLGLTDYGTAPGCAGDLVILDAKTPLEAIVEKPDRRYVIRRGRVVAETETRRMVVGE
ncbi:MAG: amidohydrolase family protein [Rhodospirillaceae bacterium]|jgi:cytosine deaminase|nr:amidohydrolase family protein [Rhodospirillaceae bacterium]MBT4774027.1 amidohydrolase family protein [Rhodospirillaceae bacterium]MBT5358590.1 amidohydrolase family protein [Rhodospirillaceae bacterium]MBT5768788.1 amidohydrolase family protein [Rhodospirillaceae bacterium]MBT6311513.1 amidohydrolase family protein [Rhodospirillaceae bacterium]